MCVCECVGERERKSERASEREEIDLTKRPNETFGDLTACVGWLESAK